MTRPRMRFAETSSGERIVIKHGDAHLLAAEVEALRAFGPSRAAIVREVHLGEGCIVLERVTPGTPLSAAATEDDALDVIARLLAPGWPPAPATPVAPSLLRFADALDRTPPIDTTRARAVLADLLGSAPPGSALLHGDLHYDNVLSSDRAGHLLIDPKGVIGDPAFDVGYLVSRTGPQTRDRLPFDRAVERRLAVLPAATGLDRVRVAAFAYVAAVLSACWALEDRDPAVHEYVAAAAVLEHHLGS